MIKGLILMICAAAYTASVLAVAVIIVIACGNPIAGFIVAAPAFGLGVAITARAIREGE